MLAAGCAVAGVPAQAAGGRVVIGFARAAAGIPAATALLKELSGRYQPDLGLDLTYLPGNVSATALAAVHQAPPDGGNVLMTPSSLMTLLPYLRTLPRIDVVNDFLPVAALASIGIAITVSPRVPVSVKTLKDHAVWLRDNPIQNTCGLIGLGTAPHFVAMVMAEALNMPIKPVFYKGPGVMVEDLLSGFLPLASLTSGAVLQGALAGGARVLAVTGAERWPGHPEVPTMQEAGIAGMPAPESFGFFVSARTPDAKLRELAEAIRQAQRSAPVQGAIASSGLLPLPAGAVADYAGLIAQERANWGLLVKAHRFSAES